MGAEGGRERERERERERSNSSFKLDIKPVRLAQTKSFISSVLFILIFCSRQTRHALRRSPRPLNLGQAIDAEFRSFISFTILVCFWFRILVPWEYHCTNSRLFRLPVSFFFYYFLIRLKPCSSGVSNFCTGGWHEGHVPIAHCGQGHGVDSENGRADRRHQEPAHLLVRLQARDGLLR